MKRLWTQVKKYLNKESILVTVAVIVALIVGIGYIPFYKDGWCRYIGICIKLDLDDAELVRTGLALAGAVLVIVNMMLIVIRIRRTDAQIEEAQNTNFLSSLHHMLYADSISKQIIGVEQLHSLAKVSRSNNKQVERILGAFCTFIRELKEENENITNDKKEEVKKRNREIRQIKQKILTKIGDKENTMYHDIKKDLRGAHLRYLDLKKSVLPNTNLQDASLKHTNLREANLEGVVIQNSEE